MSGILKEATLEWKIYFHYINIVLYIWLNYKLFHQKYLLHSKRTKKATILTSNSEPLLLRVQFYYFLNSRVSITVNILANQMLLGPLDLSIKTINLTEEKYQCPLLSPKVKWRISHISSHSILKILNKSTQLAVLKMSSTRIRTGMW